MRVYGVVIEEGVAVLINCQIVSIANSTSKGGHPVTTEYDMSALSNSEISLDHTRWSILCTFPSSIVTHRSIIFLNMWPFSSSNPTSPPDNASIIATFSPPPNPTPSNLAPPPTHPRISTTALANPSSADKCPVDAETRGKWLQASLGRNDGPSPFVSDGGSRNGNVEGNRNAEAGPSVKTVRGGAPPGKIISAGSFGAGGRRRNEQVQQSDVPARDDSVPDECPVDHQTRKTWLEQAGTATEDGLPTSSTSGAGGFASLASTTTQDSTSDTSSSSTPELKNLPKLSTSRVISSIPRGTGPSSLLEPGTNNPLPPPTIDSESSPEKWVYPSEHQFFLAMLRKNHNPQPKDMSTIVPIHNAVNERTWGEVLKWEEGKGGEECGGVRLVSFRGRPGERSPRAWMNVLLG